MQRVTGIGGIFFKARDPKNLLAWYEEHLGIVPQNAEEREAGCVSFLWRERGNPERVGSTVWSPFKHDTTYFHPSTDPFMINYRVADLTAVLDQLRREGVTVDDRVEETEFGRFGWIMDPEGNRIELWQPPEGM